MVSIRGISYANPDVFADSDIVTTGVSVPGNNRLMVVLGEGSRREVLVSNAQGRGNDGLDPTYTTSTGSDGRHFLLSNVPVVSNRTTLLKNGAPLTILEGTIDGTAFSNRYDAKLDITTGQIELQRARIFNQGGSDYVAASTNRGDGYIVSLSLIDENAPEETWTIRCSSTKLDSLGQPIDGYGLFTVSGSVSGVSTRVWQSDGYVRDNGILRFAIQEGASTFWRGDTFTIRVVSGVLKANSNLVANYIAQLDINTPEFFTEMDQVTAKHGLPSTTNNLSLGCQIGFANNPVGIYTLQCAPPLPRKTTYTLIDTATGQATAQDLSFPLPIGAVPDADTEVRLFLVNNSTNVRTQILPNKVAFFNAGYTTNPSSFIFGSESYSYTVVMQPGLVRSGESTTIEVDTDPAYAWLSDTYTTFNSDDLTATYRMVVFGSTAGNDSTGSGFEVVEVVDGKIKIYRSAGSFADESGNTDLTWRLVDTDTTVQSATVLLTADLVLDAGVGLECMIIDIKDATFYDAGWVTALEKLETLDIDIVVPLPKETISVVIQNTLQHCLYMSQVKNKKERVLITGAMMGLLPANVTGEEHAAVENIGILEGIQGDDPLEILNGDIEDLTNYDVEDAFGSTYRCIYMYPDKIVVNISGTNTFVHGFYMAPALGAWFSGRGNVAEPATNKNLSGFTILVDRTYSVQVSENITRKGICLVEPILGGGRIVWAKTTSASGFPEEEESSIVFIRDKIAKVCRTAMKGFIGLPESPITTTNMLTRMNGLLIGFLNTGLITDFRDLVISRDTVDPRQWNVRFAVQPVYPINWIYIKFEIGAF